jgi:hypothetical protein
MKACHFKSRERRRLWLRKLNGFWVLPVLVAPQNFELSAQDLANFAGTPRPTKRGAIGGLHGEPS